ncbi:MAG TPA: ScpA family protein [Candidatus Acidoferrum sp.]|nr:ScpA family protein [Candidatus Acidoferrum sp.]
MTTSDKYSASEPLDDFDERSIDILVSLAKDGEIDPWDIDIVDMTDKFLAKVEKMEKLDLRISSRTLLFASMLLRMKSDALAEREYDKEDDSGYVEEDDGPEYFPTLKHKVRRRAKRRVTLSELIEELKKATKRKERSDIRRLRAVHHDNVDALVAAHSEDIEKQIELLSSVLKQRQGERGYILFSELIAVKTPEDVVKTYIPLLFMANRRQIKLEQQEIFGDIFIKCRNL